MPLVLALLLSASVEELPDGGTFASHFPLVTFAREDPKLTWKKVELKPTQVWSAPKGRRGQEVSYCERDDVSRLAVQASTEKQGEPSVHLIPLKPAGAPVVAPNGFLFPGQRLDFACVDVAAQLFKSTVVVTDLVHGTFEVAELDLPGEHCQKVTFPAPDFGVKTCGPAGVWWYVDVAARRARLATPDEGRAFEQRLDPRATPPRLAGATCPMALGVGPFVQARCFTPKNVEVEVLWSPDAGTLERLTDITLAQERGLTTGPFVAVRRQVERVFDEPTLRLLVPDDGPLLWKDESSQRVIDSIQPRAGGFELRRYRLDDAAYSVLRRYDAKDCAGLLTLGDVRRRGSLAAVSCVRPVGTSNVATLVWSEVLDVERHEVWRTRLEVRTVSAAGAVVLTDLTRFDRAGAFTHVWLLRLR